MTKCNSQQKHTPEFLVAVFGDESKKIVGRNLKTACRKWQEKYQWVTDVQNIISRYPNDDCSEITIACVYKTWLPQTKRELWRIEKHIRHLQKCFDLLHDTNAFAPKYPKHDQVDVAALKEHVNIVDVINQEVELRQYGNRFKGRCPFHHDKSPSFVVFEDTQRWWCFACSEGGDVISFIQKFRNCDFKSAVNELRQQLQQL